jgi:ABC-2 type transport system permease protein
MLLRASPMILVSAVLFPLISLDHWALRAPASLEAFGLFLVSILVALLLASTFSMIMSISLFWTISGEGVANLFPALFWSLCGIILPIPFYPEWLQPILRVLPFRGLMDVPFQIYVGSILPQQAITEIGIQALWTIGCIGFSQYLLNYGVKRVVVQGG